jgi:hypothetical protein
LSIRKFISSKELSTLTRKRFLEKLEMYPFYRVMLDLKVEVMK